MSQLQEDLNRVKGPSDQLLATDGVFGAKTEHRLRAFQERHGLQVDGIAGPKTLGRLDLASAQVKNSPGSSPAQAPPTRAVQPPRPSTPAQMSREQAYEFIRQYSDDYERLRRGAGHKLDNFVGAFNTFNDIQGLVSAIGVLDKAYVLGNLSTGASFLGVFALTWAFLRDWERALRSGEVVYGYRAAAYAATAWAFERPMLDQSRVIRQRAVDMRGDERGLKLDEAWKESTDKVRLYLQTRNFEGFSPQTVKKTIQALYGHRPDIYCGDLLRQFDPLISPQHIAVWRDNHHIVYPN